MAIDTLETRRNILTPLEKAGVAATPQQPAIRPAPEFKELRKSLESRGVITAGKDGADLNALKRSGRDDIRHVQSRLADAGLYPATKAMNDGRIGGMTDHALKLAADKGYALEYLEKTALKGKDLNEADTMKMQAALNRLGYDTGKVDGAFGKKSATALNDFLKERPQLAANMDPSLKEAVEKNLGKGALTQAFSVATKISLETPEPALQKPKSSLPTLAANGYVLLNPDLIQRMERNSDTANYVKMTFAAAEKHGLDPHMLANQFWRESKYDPNAISPAGARGIAQFMPGTGAQRGLKGQDFFDPEKSIEKGAEHVASYKNKYSQKLTLAAFNGGEGSIEYVKKHTPKSNITHEDFMDKMEQDRQTYGTKNKSSWRVETYKYLKEILPEYWSEEKIKLALSKPENQIAPSKPLDLKPNEPAFAKLEDGKNITTAMKLDTTFGKAASMTGLSLAGITPNVTQEQKAGVAAYDTATLSGKFNLAQLDMTPKTPDMDAFNPQIKRDLAPVGLG